MGWNGPFQLYSGPPGTAPSCPAAAANGLFTAFQSPHQDPAQCTTCTVGQPYGFWCFAAVSGYPDNTCSPMDADTVFFGQDYCNILGPTDYAAAVGTEPPQATYTCDVPMQNPTVPPLAWDTVAIGCAAGAPALGACPQSQQCAAAPSAPFASRLCIFKSGDVACPGTAYPVKSVYYSGASDKRTCTPCGFTNTPISCDGTAVMYSDSSCGNAIGSVNDYSGACWNLQTSIGSTKLLGATFTGTPSCAPVGGQPAGAVQPINPLTVCCAP